MNNDHNESAKLPASQPAKSTSASWDSFRAIALFVPLAILNVLFWFGVFLSDFQPMVFAAAAFFFAFSGVLWYLEADYRWKRRDR